MKIQRIVAGLSFLFLIVNASGANAAGVSTKKTTVPEKINFHCMTETPTTSFMVDTKDGKVQLVLINHYGTEYMPIHQGIITRHDLDYLKSVADVITKIGTRAIFEFPLSDCQTSGNDLYACYHGKTIASGLNVESVSFETSRNIEQILGGDSFSNYQVTLSVLVGSNSYDITAQYQENECLRN